MKHHMFTMALMSSVIPSLYGETIKQPHTPGDHMRVASKHAGQAVSDLGNAVAHLGTGAAEGITNVVQSVWDTLKKPLTGINDKHKRLEEKRTFLDKAFLELKLHIFNLFANALGNGRLMVPFLSTYNDMIKIGKELLEEKFKEEYGY